MYSFHTLLCRRCPPIMQEDFAGFLIRSDSPEEHVVRPVMAVVNSHLEMWLFVWMPRRDMMHRSFPFRHDEEVLGAKAFCLPRHNASSFLVLRGFRVRNSSRHRRYNYHLVRLGACVCLDTSCSSVAPFRYSLPFLVSVFFFPSNPTGTKPDLLGFRCCLTDWRFQGFRCFWFLVFDVGDGCVADKIRNIRFEAELLRTKYAN